MAPVKTSPYNPSDNNVPSIALPDGVVGLVDLKTLVDIHRYLRESAAEEDAALAAWVEENYLNATIEPNQSGRSIRTPEGFSQLDRAYRRVRSLTGKAQDKWPFFDRNWKTMSTITVRNNARGEAAPGQMYQGNATHIPPSAGRLDASSSTTDSGLALVSSSKQPGRKRTVNVDFIRPSQPTPTTLLAKNRPKHINLPAAERLETSTEQSDLKTQPHIGHTSPYKLPEHADHVSEPDRQITPQQDTIPTDVPGSIRGEVSPSAPTTIKAAHDLDSSPFRGVAKVDSEMGQNATAGKVRARNGRFLSKDKPSPPSAKQRHALGSAHETDSMKSELDELEAREANEDKTISTDSLNVEDILNKVNPPDSSIDGGNLEDYKASESVSSVSIAIDDNDNPEGRVGIQPTTHVHFRDQESNESTPSYILAVEANPVLSNLDRLPPMSYRRSGSKRKSDPTTQVGSRKRGRLLKPDSVKDKDQNETNSSEQEQLPVRLGANEPVVEEVVGVTTRRSSRRSAVSSSTSTIPGKSKRANNIEVKQPEISETDEDATMVNVDDAEDTIAGHEESVPASVASEIKPSPRTSKPAKDAVRRLTRSRRSAPAFDDMNKAQISNAKLPVVGLSKTAPQAKSKKFVTLKTSIVETPEPAVAVPNGVDSLPELETSADADKTEHHSAGAIQESNGTSVNGHVAPCTPGHVEYFARVHTFTGTIEVPIAADKLDAAENELLTKYAAYNSKKNAPPTSLEQFRHIFAFMTQG